MNITGIMNTQISYTYRDGSNYKVWNDAVISGQLTADQCQTILDCCADGEYFIPSAVGLPSKTFVDLGYAYDEQDDHPWFELDKDSFFDTTNPPTVSISAEALVANFVRAKNNWEKYNV